MKKPETVNELDKTIKNLEQDATYVLSGRELAEARSAINDLEKMRPLLLSKEERDQLNKTISIVSETISNAKKFKI